MLVITLPGNKIGASTLSGVETADIITSITQTCGELVTNLDLLCLVSSNGKIRTEELEVIEQLKVTIIEDIKQSSIRRKVNFVITIQVGEVTETIGKGTGYLLMDSLVLQYNKKYYKAKKIIISSDKHIKL